MTTKKKASSTKQRASVGRELKLALALRAMLDASVGDLHGEEPKSLATAKEDAESVLKGLGYSDLEGIPRRLARLNELLKQALAMGDGAEIARLGNELVRAQQGKPPLKLSAVPAVRKSSRSGGAKSSTVSTATETDDAASVAAI